MDEYKEEVDKRILEDHPVKDESFDLQLMGYKQLFDQVISSKLYTFCVFSQGLRNFAEFILENMEREFQADTFSSLSDYFNFFFNFEQSFQDTFVNLLIAILKTSWGEAVLINAGFIDFIHNIYEKEENFGNIHDTTWHSLFKLIEVGHAKMPENFDFIFENDNQVLLNIIMYNFTEVEDGPKIVFSLFLHSREIQKSEDFCNYIIHVISVLSQDHFNELYPDFLYLFKSLFKSTASLELYHLFEENSLFEIIFEHILQGNCVELSLDVLNEAAKFNLALPESTIDPLIRIISDSIDKSNESVLGAALELIFYITKNNPRYLFHFIDEGLLDMIISLFPSVSYSIKPWCCSIICNVFIHCEKQFIDDKYEIFNEIVKDICDVDISDLPTFLKAIEVFLIVSIEQGNYDSFDAVQEKLTNIIDLEEDKQIIEKTNYLITTIEHELAQE